MLPSQLHIASFSQLTEEIVVLPLLPPMGVLVKAVPSPVPLYFCSSDLPQRPSSVLIPSKLLLISKLIMRMHIEAGSKP